jgi:uncharacterized DUF497 family protein
MGLVLTRIFNVRTIITVEIEFDAAKDANNLRKHGISLARAAEIDWQRLKAVLDTRADYGEDRYLAAAPISGRLCIVVFTIRENTLRIISLRRANRREIRRYETQS